MSFWQLPVQPGTKNASKRIIFCFRLSLDRTRKFGIFISTATVPGEFPTQRPVTQSFDVFFDLRLNKRLSKQPWGWWFETLSWSLWRHCNAHECSPRYAYIPRGCSVKLTDWIKLRKQGYFNRPNNRCIVLPPVKFQSEISVTLGELGGRSA